jgi:CBS-domain-containing membrane protein
MLVATFQGSCKSTKIIKKMKKVDIKKSVLAGLFSAATLGVLTLLTYKTEFGLFLITSFGSSMVLLFGYPEISFSQPKNIFFGHLLTSIVGIIFLYIVPLPIYLIIPLAVGFGVALMMLLNVTHPPAGANPIIVIMGSVSLDYLINPIIIGSLIILAFGVILNRLILKKKYPL